MPKNLAERERVNQPDERGISTSPFLLQFRNQRRDWASYSHVHAAPAAASRYESRFKVLFGLRP